jgi:hypothetical protein
VGGQENNDVKGDEGERDDGPAAPLHAFVAEGDQYHARSFLPRELE